MAWMLGRELRARRRRDGASMAWTPAAEIAPSPRGRQSSVRAVAALESSYAIDATGHGRNVAYRHAGTATTEYAKTHRARIKEHFRSGSPENVLKYAYDGIA